MSHIHWVGAGLSSGPGIRKLADGPTSLTLWNRTVSKARDILAGRTGVEICALDNSDLEDALNPGDVVVSMLPASRHTGLAEMCLRQTAHFVCSSYISPQMKSFHARATQNGLCLVNEVGLDPGLDHLLAHDLVHRYQNSSVYNPGHKHLFRSYCGGFPMDPGEFKYKFSWSPIGVLKALKTSATWLQNGEQRTTDAPWRSLSTYPAPQVQPPESFEAYPNRDSLPFIRQYGMDGGWKMEEFVRGTLRLNGWAEAWAEIFETLDNLAPEKAEATLTGLSEELWRKYAYGVEEPDRVVLCVELEVKSADEITWHQGYTVDETGNPSGSAMARLVSLPMSLAVESILENKVAPGVTAAPSNPHVIQAWLDSLRASGEKIVHWNQLENS